MATAQLGPSDNIGSYMTCAICLGIVSNHRALPCQHTFCLECLEPLVRGSTVVCPLCKEACRLNTDGAAVLPKNPLLSHILERFCEDCLKRDTETKCHHYTEKLKTRRTPQRDESESSTDEENDVIIYHVIHFLELGLVRGSPSRLAISPLTGGIVFATSSENNIHILDHSNKYVSRIGGLGKDHGQFRLTPDSGVAVTQQGHIAVADTLNNRIQLFTQYGEFISAFGSRGTGLGRFHGPTGLCSRGDQLYVCDRHNGRIQITKEDGSVLRVIRTRDMEPQDLAVCPKLNVVVIGRLPGRDVSDTRVYGPEGRQKATLGTGEPGTIKLGSPEGVTIDKSGLVFVTDARTFQLHALRQNGDFVQSFGSPGRKPGQFDRPTGVAITGDGRIVVADMRNERLQIFSIN